MLSLRRLAVAAAFACAVASPVHAGPYILAGTDADDHGDNNGGTGNDDGWLFMQRALENIAASSALTTANRVVIALGSESSALAAAASAFQFSNLVAAGWTFQSVASITAANYATALSTAGIIMLDSGGNVTGGLTTTERTFLSQVDNANALNTFLANGGGLFSQSNGYGFLSALIPGLTTTNFETTGLTLTPAGNAAFPGLTNADLSSGPWHNYFNNVGPIPVLANGLVSGNNVPVILGAAGGSITNPDPPIPAIPEPETYALMAAGLAALGFVSRRQKRKSAAK